MQLFLLALQEANKSVTESFWILWSIVRLSLTNAIPLKIQAIHIASFFHQKVCLNKTVTVTVLSGLITDLTSLWSTDHADKIYAYLEEICFFFFPYVLAKEDRSTAANTISYDFPAAQTLIHGIGIFKESEYAQ